MCDWFLNSDNVSELKTIVLLLRTSFSLSIDASVYLVDFHQSLVFQGGNCSCNSPVGQVLGLNLSNLFNELISFPFYST